MFGEVHHAAADEDVLMKKYNRLGNSSLRFTRRCSRPIRTLEFFFDRSLAVPMSMFKNAVISAMRSASQGDSDEDANEALRQAIESNRPDKVTRAIKKGANVDLKDESTGVTRLILASLDTHESVLELLLANGANPNKKDGKLRSPLHHASANNQAVAAEILLQHEAPVDSKDVLGRTALMDACQAKNLAVVDTLLTFKSSVKAKDSQGKFPLLLACEGEGSLDLVKKLMAAGADVKMCSDDGRTALHEAVMKSDLTVVKFLVEQGVDLGARTVRGETAHDLAHAWKNSEVEGYLAGFELLDHDDDAP